MRSLMFCLFVSVFFLFANCKKKDGGTVYEVVNGVGSDFLRVEGTRYF